MARKRNIRKWLNKEEVEILEELRMFEKTCKEQGLNPDQVKHGWFKSKETSSKIRRFKKSNY